MTEPRVPHQECIKAALRCGSVDPRERTLELRDEVRRLQRVLIDAEVLTDCQDLCAVVCAGPCQGVNVGDDA